MLMIFALQVRAFFPFAPHRGGEEVQGAKGKMTNQQPTTQNICRNNYEHKYSFKTNF